MEEFEYQWRFIAHQRQVIIITDTDELVLVS